MAPIMSGRPPRSAKFGIVDENSRVAQHGRLEKEERRQTRELEAAGWLSHAHMNRDSVQETKVNAKLLQQLTRESKQTLARSIRATEAEWQTERSSWSTHRSSRSATPEKTGPLPAAFGSYSTWAGSSNAYLAAASPPAPTAAFKDGMKRSWGHDDSLRGDPGAYEPYENSTLAATATFTQSRRAARSANEPAAQATLPLPPAPPAPPPDQGSQEEYEEDEPEGKAASTDSTDMDPLWWLFALNRIPLRFNATDGERVLATGGDSISAGGECAGYLQAPEPAFGQGEGGQGGGQGGDEEGGGQEAGSAPEAHGLAGVTKSLSETASERPSTSKIQDPRSKTAASTTAHRLPKHSTLGTFLGDGFDPRSVKKQREERDAAERQGGGTVFLSRRPVRRPKTPNEYHKKKLEGRPQQGEEKKECFK